MDARGRPPGTERSPGTSGEGERGAFADELAAARSESRGRAEREVTASEPGARRDAESIGTHSPAPHEGEASEADEHDDSGPLAPSPRSEPNEKVDEGEAPAPGEPAAKATPETSAAGPAPSENTAVVNVVPTRLATVAGQEPAPAKLPAPAAPVSVAAAAALGVPNLALPATATDPSKSGAATPTRGAASVAEAATGSEFPAEAPPPVEGPTALDAAALDDVDAGEQVAEAKVAQQLAHEGRGGAHAGEVHGIAPASHPEGARDHAPEAALRAPALATSADAMERAERVLQQLRLKITPGLNRATLALEPANLGRIAIAIEVRGGQLKAVLRAEKRSTLGVLENHVPELRAMLEQSGIDAKDIDLGLGSGGDAGPDAGAREGSGSKSGGAAHDPFDFEGMDAAGGSRLARAITDELGVDTYA